MEDLSPFYICGATATGKSSVALRLVEEMNGEIINADAFQLYQGLDIITACPAAEDLEKAPHHLYACLPVTEEMNAMKYREMAQATITEVQERGKVPLLTGGSGMYLKFLTHGPSPIPAADPDLRKELEARDLSDLLSELKERDPEVLETFPPENKRYVIRALEISLMTGEKASALKAHWNTLPDPPPRGILIIKSIEDTLKSIERRADQMLSQGAIEEVRALPPPEDLPTAGKAIGVPEIRAYLSGELSYEECKERLIISTRQYAKRQRNWFKKETWLKPHEL